MGCKTGLLFALTIWMAVTTSVNAAVIFSQFTIDEVATQGQLQSAAQAADTSAIAGVAAEPGPAGDIFAIHSDNSQMESFLRVTADGSPTRITDSAGIAQQLGSPYGAALSLTGGFAYSPVANALYFAEDAYGVPTEVSMVKLSAETGAATLVKRTTDLAGLSDHSVMPDGTILVARPSAAVTGLLEPATGTYTSKLTEAQFLAASPGASSLPPESIAGDPVSGKSYVSAHGDHGLFEVDNFAAASPVPVRLTQSELTGVDLHDLAVDQYGNLYGLDVATNQIVIIRSTDKAVFTFPLTQIAMALGKPAFAAVPWRGIAARIAGYAQADLFLSSGNSTYGIVRVRFGSVPSSVKDWTLY